MVRHWRVDWYHSVVYLSIKNCRGWSWLVRSGFFYASRQTHKAWMPLQGVGYNNFFREPLPPTPIGLKQGYPFYSPYGSRLGYHQFKATRRNVLPFGICKFKFSPHLSFNTIKKISGYSYTLNTISDYVWSQCHCHPSDSHQSKFHLIFLHNTFSYNSDGCNIWLHV